MIPGHLENIFPPVYSNFTRCFLNVVAPAGYDDHGYENPCPGGIQLRYTDDQNVQLGPFEGVNAAHRPATKNAEGADRRPSPLFFPGDSIDPSRNSAAGENLRRAAG
jgi:hypothetical protein